LWSAHISFAHFKRDKAADGTSAHRNHALSQENVLMKISSSNMRLKNSLTWLVEARATVLVAADAKRTGYMHISKKQDPFS